MVVALVAAVAIVPTITEPAAAALRPRAALLHRLNQVRAAHHLAPVYPTRTLRRTARGHSDDMLVRDYFAHTSPTGVTFSDRIARSGFVSGYSWLGGETLAWGTGSRGSPRWTVRAWIHSPEHRAILLSTTYRWIGIARTCGRFNGYPNACVWTADWIKRW